MRRQTRKNVMQKKNNPGDNLRRYIKDVAGAFEQMKETSHTISLQNEQLRAERELMQQIIDHIPAWLMIISAEDFHVRWMNGRMEEASGLKASESKPLSLIDNIHEDDQYHVRRIIDFLHAHPGQCYRVLLRVVNTWGDVHYLNLTASVFQRGRSGVIKRIFVTAIDVTKLQETEKDLKRVLRELAAIRLENSDHHITRREMDVLRLIAKEKSTKQIADELDISIPTVETHRRNLLRKVEVKNTAGLIRFAMENMLLE